MANGDDAAAAGLSTVPSSGLVKNGYDEINKSRDFIARHGIGTLLKHAIADITGLVGATGLFSTGLIMQRPVATPAGTGITSGLNIVAANDITANGALRSPAIDVTGASVFFGGARVTPVTTSWVAAYFNGDGRLGAAPSSRRFKQNIKKAAPDVQAIFALQLVEYRYKAAVKEFGDGAQLEMGLIAEEVDKLGLTWLVVYDDDGKPFAVRYEMIALALLPIVRDHEDRLSKLEAAAS